MTLDNWFSLLNSTALASWVLLVGFPHNQVTRRLLDSYAIPLVLSVIYTWFAVSSLTMSDLQSFSTLRGVVGLFSSPAAVLTGWIHYLAFDLFVGVWINKESRAHKTPHIIRVPCLILTFMLGPIGFMSYVLARTFTSKAGRRR